MISSDSEFQGMNEEPIRIMEQIKDIKRYLFFNSSMTVFIFGKIKNQMLQLTNKHPDPLISTGNQEKKFEVKKIVPHPFISTGTFN